MALCLCYTKYSNKHLGVGMKAAQISQYGDTSVVSINEIEVPSPGEGQVLVEVHASSLNPFDTVVRAGYMKDSLPLQFPATLGGDIAGIVTATGTGVTTFSVGDKIYGQANVVAGNSGAFAEFAATKASQVGKVPSTLSMNEAAAMPLVGVSALQAVTDHLNLQPGQRIFIHGGAGGIGSIAIQIAKHIGAYVATTATGEGMTLAKELGADEVIDYKTQDFSEVLKDFDAVFDTVGHDDFVKSYTVLKKGGVAVSMIAPSDEAAATTAGITSITQGTKVTTEHLDKLTALIEEGVVTTRIGKVYPLSEVRQAFEARESGTIQGKIVLEIQKS